MSLRVIAACPPVSVGAFALGVPPVVVHVTGTFGTPLPYWSITRTIMGAEVVPVVTVCIVGLNRAIVVGAPGARSSVI